MTRSSKKSSSPNPEGAKLDPKIGFILAASLPLSVIVFWKITLPFVFYSASTILGNDVIQQMQFFGQDIWGLMTSPCPPWISAEDKAFLQDQSFHQIRRLTNFTPESFAKLVEEGVPFIVTDVIKDWKGTMDWNCSNFARHYPDAEYFSWQTGTKMKMREFLSNPNGLRCSKGLLYTDTEANKEYMKEWLSLMFLPIFMHHSTEANVEDSDDVHLTGHIGSIETGFAPFIENSCLSFMVAQISGTQLWSLSWPELVQGSVRWKKPIRFYLQPGDILFSPFAARQSFEVVEGCSLSFTRRFKSPASRELYSDISNMLSDYHEDVCNLYESVKIDDKLFLEDCKILEVDGAWSVS